ncbi:MAG: RDD family protein [Phycisphaerales bacterium]|nr:RDD family protein [Phycisphaerales bacterium]
MVRLLVGLVTMSLMVAPLKAADLLVAGGENNAWFVVPEKATIDGVPEWALAHHGRQDEPGVYHTLRRFDQKPTTLATLDHSVWLTLQPRQDRPAQVPVRVLRVGWNDRIERYIAEPRTGLGVLPDIQTDVGSPGTPVDMVATSTGPAVLLSHDGGTWSVQRLRRGRWEVVDVPTMDPGSSLRLGLDDDRLVLVASHDDNVDLWWQEGTDWTGPTRYAATGPVLDLATVGGRLVISTQPAAERVALAYAQPGGLAQLGSWSPAEGDSWSVLALRGRPALGRVGESLEVSAFDPLTGTQGPWMSYQPGSPLGIGVWPVLVAFTASAIVLLVLLRGRPDQLSLPADLGPLPPVTRLLALFIDALPGLVVVFTWGEGEFRLLIDAVFLSLDASEWVIYATLVGITCGWTLAWELLVATSPGKMLAGAGLVREDGSRPSGSRLILRTLLKGMILLLPVLAVTALRPPGLQSAADQAARIVVVRSQPPAEASDEDG